MWCWVEGFGWGGRWICASFGWGRSRKGEGRLAYVREGRDGIPDPAA